MGQIIRIMDKRGSGKTSRLMLLAKENNGTIVCSNPRAMEYKAHQYGLVGINFISYEDFFMRPGAEVGNYYIDEMDAMLDRLQSFCKIHGSLKGYTISEDD